MEQAVGTPPGSSSQKSPIPDEQVAREHTWVLAAQAGDQATFGRLVEAYQVPVYNLAYRMLGNPQEAEDAAQETFLRAYANLASYDPTRKFSSWLFSIASHYCIDRLRRRRLRFIPLDEAPRLHESLPDHQHQPEATALAREEEQLVQHLLAQLPENYRLVITLFYWYDLSCQEIGEVVGISEGAVKVRLHRGRKKLAELIRANEARAERPASSRIPSPKGARKEGHEHALSRC
jgi:RNA polymerase sigma-70 factor (ECF subfamily)